MAKRSRTTSNLPATRSKAYLTPLPRLSNTNAARSVRTTVLRKTAGGNLGARQVTTVTPELTKLAPPPEQEFSFVDTSTGNQVLPNLSDFFTTPSPIAYAEADDNEGSEKESSSLIVSKSLGIHGYSNHSSIATYGSMAHSASATLAG
jgi:hypothetical protein